MSNINRRLRGAVTSAQQQQQKFRIGEHVDVFLGRKMVTSGAVAAVQRDTTTGQTTYYVNCRTSGRRLGPFFEAAVRPHRRAVDAAGSNQGTPAAGASAAVTAAPIRSAANFRASPLPQHSSGGDGDRGGGRGDDDDEDAVQNAAVYHVFNPSATAQERRALLRAYKVDIAAEARQAASSGTLMAPHSRRPVSSLTASEARTELRFLKEPSHGTEEFALRMRLAEALLLRRDKIRKDHRKGSFHPAIDLDRHTAVVAASGSGSGGGISGSRTNTLNDADVTATSPVVCLLYTSPSPRDRG